MAPDIDLARVLDEMADAAIVVDATATIRYANRAAATMLATEDAVGKPLISFVPPRYHEQHTQGFARYLRTRTGLLVGGHPVRVPALRADGTEVDIQLTLQATTGLDGELLVVGSLRDVSAVRELERRAAVARYLQASMDVAEQLHKAASADMALPMVLPTLCERLDWDVAALWEVRDGVLANVDVWHVGAAIDPDFVIQTRTRRFSRGERLPGRVWSLAAPMHFEQLADETNFARRDAGAAAGLQSALALPLMAGNTVLGVIELFSLEPRKADTAELEVVSAIGKQLGQFLERMRAEDELRSSEQRYRSLAEATSMDVFRTSASGELLIDIPRWRRITGQSVEEVTGMGWLSAIVPEDQPRVAALWNEALASGLTFEAEYEIRTAAGSNRVIYAHAVPIFDEGRLTEWIGTSADVTAQRHTERAVAALAQTLQRSLLPPHLPHIPGFDLASSYYAGGDGLRVGGDFYDVFAVDPQTWVFVIGDVCGKGAEAATVTALARHTIRATAMREPRPAAIARVLNDALRRAEEAPFVTALVAVATLNGGQSITLCCAGHPAPLVRTANGQVAEVGVPGDLLGVFDEVSLTETNVELAQDALLLMYTDGVTEARDRGGAEFGVESLARLLAGTTGINAEATVGTITESVLAHRGPTSRDDVALLAIGRKR